MTGQIAATGFDRRQPGDVPEPSGPDRYALAVGTATHQVIAQLVELRHLDRADLLDRAWSLAAAALAKPTGEDRHMARRGRAAQITVAGGAAVYLERFMPPASWRLVGSELTLGPGARTDLTWECDGSILVDEVKTADGRTLGTGVGPTAGQASRYLDLARAAHGAAFLGLRLLYIGAASRSQFHRPDGRVLALCETPYGFGAQHGVNLR